MIKWKFIQSFDRKTYREGIEMDFKNIGFGLDSSGSAWVTVAGSLEHFSEHSESIRRTNL
jgi:hypothetical protein